MQTEQNMWPQGSAAGRHITSAQITHSIPAVGFASAVYSLLSSGTNGCSKGGEKGSRKLKAAVPMRASG